MKIESIRVKNYKVFQNIEVENIPNMAVFLGMTGVGTVSYTHLAVYKRQFQPRTMITPGW